jgi:hypothetical protein
VTSRTAELTHLRVVGGRYLGLELIGARAEAYRLQNIWKVRCVATIGSRTGRNACASAVKLSIYLTHIALITSNMSNVLHAQDEIILRAETFEPCLLVTLVERNGRHTCVHQI